jgi:hypothetical protein
VLELLARSASGPCPSHASTAYVHEVSFRESENWLVGRDYLRDATFVRKAFKADEYNDHEHCDLCSATLDVGDDGYETSDDSPHPDGGHYWLCPDCFAASRRAMGWTQVPG